MKGIEAKHWTTSWSQEGEQRCAQFKTFGMTRNVKRLRHKDKIKHHEGSTRIETPHLERISGNVYFSINLELMEP